MQLSTKSEARGGYKRKEGTRRPFLNDNDKIYMSMKKIESIRVKVTYQVGLGGIEVDDETYNALLEVAANRVENAAFEWLNANIRERDCCDLNYE